MVSETGRHCVGVSVYFGSERKQNKYCCQVVNESRRLMSSKYVEMIVGLFDQV